jgi:uncharacterized membrane protein
MYDDNPLPNATELEALKAIDPDLIKWITTRADKEQEHRHNTINTKLKVLKSSETNSNVVNVLGLIFSFIFLIGGMAGSIYLIIQGFSIQGSIFGGIILIAGATILRSKKTQEPDSKVRK